MLILFLVIVTGAALPFSSFFIRVFTGDMSRGIPGHIEKTIYRFTETDPDHEDGWKGYARDLLAFNGIGFVILFILLLLQGFLPFNPENFGAFNLFTAINTATSFVTNTNWQVYSGETTASYLTQMAGFTVQNFLSSATGICIAIAVMRGITRQSTDRIGNFWVDITRCTLYILLPIAFIFALILASQGVIQNLDPYAQAIGYVPTGQQTIAMGPVASQEAIKELGTNGGGFFNANAAHPYENPTSLTNLIEVFLILLIPVTLPLVFGRMTGKMWQGWMIYTVMLVLFLGSFCTLYAAELTGNPLVKELGVSGISMEGKEVRLGLFGSSLFATSTTATSCGAVNSMHDSLTPLGGLVTLFMMLLGEVAFGGVGSGFYTMIGFVVLSVFIAGLMIGRTPEYLGKKIEVLEMRAAVIAVLVPGVLVLLLSGIALVLPNVEELMKNPGPHGLSELIYAFASMSQNNGSAFAGFDASKPFYTLIGSLAMVIGRFVPAVSMLALAGSLAQKKKVPPSSGTLPTASVTFSVWMILVILIIGALTFFPLFAMGPIAEHLTMIGGI
ncbi:potassium-transporting ATPase subunit KdpA [Methanosarcina sp. UBA289]|uniref:potassium-transporting ATPase subunit KdpA n=1 Tax=Methanosarcina sp. UBA289 TaxID=1915574 RepID=UPI0025CCFC15|nr:potassium-transporting ATPase subunit KdpA [Methanosarcina sp. UBA289]